MNKGMLYAISAYIFWGLHPIYWKLLSHVPSVEIVSHRITWSFIFFLILISLSRGWKPFFEKFRERKKWIFFVPAFLIGSNWAMYIWAVNADYVIETSLGYFICPLVSVFLGVVFLKERMRMMQWSAVVIAFAGVLAMTLFYGQFPWISLFLAFTWGAYGLLRKQSPLNSVEGLTLETAMLSIPSLIYIGWLGGHGESSFFMDVKTTLLLIGAGVTSGLPLYVFITGARMVKLSVIGLLQYIYPMLILSVGVLIYREPFTTAKFTGFIFVWIALIVFTIDYLVENKRRQSNAVV